MSMNTDIENRDMNKIKEARDKTIKLRINQMSKNKQRTCQPPKSIFHTNSGFQLSGHQIAAGQLVSTLNPGDGALIRSSTGSGKTMMIWEMVRQLHDRWPNGKKTMAPNLIIVCTDDKELKNAETELVSKYMRAIGSKLNYSSNTEQQWFKSEYMKQLNPSRNNYTGKTGVKISEKAIDKMIEFVRDAAPPSYLILDIQPRKDKLIDDQSLEEKERLRLLTGTDDRWWYWNRKTDEVPSRLWQAERLTNQHVDKYKIMFKGESLNTRLYKPGHEYQGPFHLAYRRVSSAPTYGESQKKYYLLRHQLNEYFNQAQVLLDATFEPESLIMSSYISLLLSFCRQKFAGRHKSGGVGESFRGVGAETKNVQAHANAVKKGRFVSFKITKTSAGEGKTEYYGPYYYVQGRIGNRVKLLPALYGGGAVNIGRLPLDIDHDIGNTKRTVIDGVTYTVELDRLWMVTSKTEDGTGYKSFSAEAYMTSNFSAAGAEVAIQYPIMQQMIKFHFGIELPEEHKDASKYLMWWMTLSSLKHKRTHADGLSFSKGLLRSNTEKPHNNPRTIVLGMTRDAINTYSQSLKNTVLILDESHELTKRNPNLKGLRRALTRNIVTQTGKNTNYVVGVTATPYTNGKKSLIKHIAALTGKELSKKIDMESLANEIKQLRLKVFWYDMSLDVYRIPTMIFGSINDASNSLSFMNTTFRVQLPSSRMKPSGSICLLKKGKLCASQLDKIKINQNMTNGTGKNNGKNNGKNVYYDINTIKFKSGSSFRKVLKNIYKEVTYDSNAMYIIVYKHGDKYYIAKKRSLDNEKLTGKVTKGTLHVNMTDVLKDDYTRSKLKQDYLFTREDNARTHIRTHISNIHSLQEN